MADIMTLQDHACQLGSLMANFHSLEFMIRAVLYDHGKHTMGIPHGHDLYEVPVGGAVGENALTNYDSLSQIIKKFNEISMARGEPALDESLVVIRDALAHGRVSAPATTDQLRLVKFSNPKNGPLVVTFNVVLTGEWFSQQKRRVLDAMRIVGVKLDPPVQVP